MSKCQFFHQCGHNDVWNRDLYEEGIGSGLILSPVNIPRNRVEELPPHIKKACYFDPQYYLPTSSRPKLITYDFHPTTVFSSGASTTSYLENYSSDQALACIQFQLENNFAGVIVPARQSQTFGESFMRFNGRLYSAFIEACREIGVEIPIFLTLPLHYAMLEEHRTVEEILNWITSFSGNDGIYLLLEKPPESKQVKNSDLLETMLGICFHLKRNDLLLIVGYCNTEGLIYTLAEADIIATGTYENLRMFSIDRWDEPDDRRGPKGRYYSPNLLNWLESGYLGTVRRRGLLDSVESSNPYSDVILSPGFTWHFQKPEIYKHYFDCFQTQINELCELPIEDRFELLLEWIENARRIYNRFSEAGIILDQDSNGDHLNFWETAIRGFWQRNYMAT